MKKWIVFTLIGLAVVLGAGYWYLQNQNPDASLFPAGAAEPTATPLPTVTAPEVVIVDGTVVPIRHAALSFATTGIVAQILVEEGDTVEAGTVLARLQNERQVIAIAQAEARVRSSRARLEKLKAGPSPEEVAAAQAAVDIARANLDSLLEGSRPEDVAAAEAALAAAQANLRRLLNGADEEQLIAALADLQNAEATLRQAQSAYDQVKWRNDVAALPQAAELERATNNYEAAKARYDLLAAGAKESEIAAAQAEVERARANLDKARTPATAGQIAAVQAEVERAEAELALRQAGARPEDIAAAEAELMEAQANLMQSQAALAETELRAPFPGTVAALTLQVGEQVVAGTPVVQLADLSAWQIETDDLTEINVVHIQEGDRAILTFDALPEVEISGTVVRIRPLGESKQGDITYTATIQPDIQDERLRWNMTASVTIQPDREE